MIYESSAFIGLAVVIQSGTNDHITIAITVDIPGACHRKTHVGTCLITFPGCYCRSINATGRTLVNEGNTFACLPVTILVSTNNNIAIPITVNISCTGY